MFVYIVTFTDEFYTFLCCHMMKSGLWVTEGPPPPRDIMCNNSITVFFSQWESSQNGTFDNEEHEEIFPGLKQEEMEYLDTKNNLYMH